MSSERVVLTIHDMHCPSCAQRVQRALIRVKGVSAVQVSLAAEQATVDRAPGSAPEAMLKETVRELGFEVPE